MKQQLFTVIFSVIASTCTAAHNIIDYGAIEKLIDLDTEKINSNALHQAILAANSTENEDHMVIIPAGKTFSSLPIPAITDISNVHIVIDGTLLVSKDVNSYKADLEKWRNPTDLYVIEEFLTFRDVENITFSGSGQIDGQGYMWWVREWLQKNPLGRPKILRINQGRNIEFSGIKVLNGPYYHLHFYDVDNVYFHDFEIEVDIMGQLEISQLLQGHQLDTYFKDGFTLRAPMFPLNTDGIDPSGSNILIERVNITNFDDAVAVKPVYGNGTVATCAENIIIRDCLVNWSIGMSIGSVPPANEYACIRNVTIKDVKLYHPIKAIYVKTNSGVTDSMLPGSGGEISNIVYDNIEIHNPIWWGVYIGPQQQAQPDGSGDGCMTYPIGGCETQPLITVSNITLNNVKQYGSILPPGIIRCNETNPCTGFNFTNVQATGWWQYLGFGYITENIEGTVTNSSPAPLFNNEYMVSPYGVMNDIIAEFVDEIKGMLHHFWVLIHPHRRHKHDYDNENEEFDHHEEHEGHGKYHGHHEDDEHDGKHGGKHGGHGKHHKKGPWHSMLKAVKKVYKFFFH